MRYHFADFLRELLKVVETDPVDKDADDSGYTGVRRRVRIIKFAVQGFMGKLVEVLVSGGFCRMEFHKYARLKNTSKLKCNAVVN